MKRTETQAIRCPLCHKGRIIDAASGTDASKLHLYGPSSMGKRSGFPNAPSAGSRSGSPFLKLNNRAAGGAKRSSASPKSSYWSSAPTALP